jgi:tetratricopeptide (TPR) repeat protein
MGKYEAAVTFYREAIDLSTNDKGEPTIPMVWGLSTQELGTVYVKMGKAQEGKELVKRTTDFARQHNILTGIAEGASRLAEFALLEGGISEALALGEEAVIAAKKCDCSPFNTAQALLVRAKAKWFNVKDVPSEKWIAVRKEFEEVLSIAKISRTKPIEAETLLLLSSTHPKDTRKRLAYLEEAITIMNDGEYELRGKAASEAGRVYFASHAPELAEHYLKFGISVTDTMLRFVDKSQELSDKAILESLAGDKKKEVELLVEAALAAEKQSQPEEAIAVYQKLIVLYQNAGYAQYAAESAIKAATQLELLLQAAPPDEKKEALQMKLANMKEVIGLARVQRGF